MSSFFTTENKKIICLNQSSYLKEVYEVVLSGCAKHVEIVSYAPKNCYFVAAQAHIETKGSLSQCFSDVNQHNDKNESVPVSDVQPHKVKNTKRKHKRKADYNQGEIDLIEYHNKIKNHLITAVFAVCDYFSLPGNPNINVETVTKSSQKSIEDHQNCCFGLYFQHLFTSYRLDHKYNFKLDNLPPLLIENSCDFSHLININKNVYLLPKKCKFLCSDISLIDPLIKECRKNGKYSCIVLDPPWENKSVKRSKKYSTLSFDEIAGLPIQEFCQDGCLIIVWVTNKQKVINWVKENLFQMWNVSFLTEWHWVKLTTSGNPVFPWDSMHKKPYEILLLGCYKSCNKLNDPSKLENLVICSVPSSIHSHKPSLCKLIDSFDKQFYDQPFHCLELFARNLTPGWTSWGNEVLMMQNLTYFEQI